MMRDDRNKIKYVQEFLEQKHKEWFALSTIELSKELQDN